MKKSFCLKTCMEDLAMKFKFLLDYAIDNHYSKTKNDAYLSVMKLLSSLYDKDLKEITFKAVEGLKKDLIERKLSNSTINSALSMISVCYDTALESDDKIFKNFDYSKPRIKKLNAQETKKSTLPLEKDMRELYRQFALDNCMTDFYHFINIAYGTLLRVNEILKINNSCIDYMNNEITITNTKNKKIHTVYMNPTVKKSIEAMKPRFFQDYTYRQILYWFEKAEKVLQLNHYTPHSTRHAGASKLKRSGVGNSVIKEAGNWSSEAIIENYTHAISTDVRTAFEKLDDEK